MNRTVEVLGAREIVPSRAPRPDGAGTSSRRRRWSVWLRSTVIGVDIVIVVATSLAAILIGVNERPEPWAPADSLLIGAITAGVALTALAVSRSWARRTLANDVGQFRRVLAAFTIAALVLAIGGLALKVDDVRPWVFGVLPVAALGVVLARWGLRVTVTAARRRGRCTSTVLVLGTSDAAGELIARTRRAPQHGWTVAAICSPDGPGPGRSVLGVPVVGCLDDVARQVFRLGVDIVAVAAASGCPPVRLRRLAWELEGTGAELAVDPGLMEVPGARLHVSPVDGLPMLRLAELRFSGAARTAKNVLDRLLAAALVLALAPVFVVVSVLVARDGGPVFYRQERVGLRGRPFRMVKFRSMVVDADDQLVRLTDANDGAGPLFKMRADPRVTRVGAVLRRFSLDELPQLFNVVAGSMSLVGPRPALRREVIAYGDDDVRRLVVRPGMTGLWQVSGRSDLSWEDSVRLDLRYVENWSPGLDASILCRTIGAVVRKDGAY